METRKHEFLEVEDLPSDPSDSSKNEDSSVANFLKQTQAFREELQREYPRLESSANESQWEASEDSDYGTQWSQINDILVKHSFAPIRLYKDSSQSEVPDLSSLTEVFWAVLAEYSANKTQLDDFEVTVKKLRKENQALRRHLKTQDSNEHTHRNTLKEQLKRTREVCKDKEGNIERLRSKFDLGQSPPRRKSLDEKECSVFRAFMHRDFDHSRHSDAKILGMIVYYENQKQKILQDYKAFKLEMEKSKTYIQNFHEDLEAQRELVEKTQKQNAVLKTRLTSGGILQEIAEDLSVNSVEEIPAAIKKIHRVISALPSMERFIENVCRILEVKTIPVDLNEVIETLGRWRKEDSNRAHLLSKLYKLIEAEEEEAFERAEAISHFCNLFEVDRAPVKAVVENLYYFVHEIKVFLSVRLR